MRRDDERGMMEQSAIFETSGCCKRPAFRIFATTAMAAEFLFLCVEPVFAHEVPEGTEWVMADWMLLSFASFFGAALLIFLVAVRRGYFRNMEDAKYYLLTVKEPDYYTPEWARGDSHAAER